MILRDLGRQPNRLNEFNHLKISNIDQFLTDYGCNINYYQSPFAVLGELEEQIKYKNLLPNTIMVPYKEDGYIVFDFVNAYEQGNLRIVVYQYSTSVS